ncbi:MAG: hypothetical protein FJY97_00025 [candidate division Zixibacteria bacterium]|nr:hypothetical protein [candidate division Zixibacteria bacterium]
MTHLSRLTSAAGVLAVVFVTGCGQTPLSSNLTNINTAAEQIATLQANGIDAELLALTSEVDEVPSPNDGLVPPPNQQPPPRIDRLKEALGLSDDQIAQIEAIVEDVRDQITAIHEQVKAGTLTRAAAREQIKAIHDDQKAQIEALLTEAQKTKFAELRQQHGRQFNIDRLAAFLGLTDEQKTQIETIMQTHRDQMAAIRQQVEAGTLSRQSAREQIKTLHNSERDQLAGVLSQEQLQKLRRVLNHHRFGLGPGGFGRGPQGNHPRPGEP